MIAAAVTHFTDAIRAAYLVGTAVFVGQTLVSLWLYRMRYSRALTTGLPDPTQADVLWKWAALMRFSHLVLLVGSAVLVMDRLTAHRAFHWGVTPLLTVALVTGMVALHKLTQVFIPPPTGSPTSKEHTP